MKKGITKKQQGEFIKKKLKENQRWAMKALLKIYDFQTRDEQDSGYTRNINGVGFTGYDGEILSSCAEHLLRKGYLTEKQLTIVMRKMPKYWRQILNLSDENTLNSMIIKG